MADPANTSVLDRVPQSDTPALSPVLAQIAHALKGLRFGEVAILVQDGAVVRVERTEKRRFYGGPSQAAFR